MSRVRIRLEQYKADLERQTQYKAGLPGSALDIVNTLLADLKQDEKENGWVPVKEIIDEQPTALDADKVVEQLEKLADEANDKILEAGGLQLYYDGYEDAMRTAVEIVKGGGIE